MTSDIGHGQWSLRVTVNPGPGRDSDYRGLVVPPSGHRDSLGEKTIEPKRQVTGRTFKFVNELGALPMNHRDSDVTVRH
jgi:hypothetical protein